MATRRLGLLRHAKSSWNESAKSDFNRTLSKRGMRDAPRMGQLLLERGVRPDCIVSSAAVRARTTAELVAHELDIGPQNIQTTNELYLASAGSILATLEELAAASREVILVGHNPGISNLANCVTNTRIDHLPTAGFFYMEADIDAWAELLNVPGRLLFFASPKNDLAAI